MLKIRLQRTGRRNNPSYRVIVIDSAVAAKKGRPVEVLGIHDTVRKETVLKKDRISHWISCGAQVSDTMHNLLIANGVLQGVKINTLPRKSPITSDQPESMDKGGAEKKDPPISDDNATGEEGEGGEQQDDKKESPSAGG